jgi:hypothetical protein
MVAQTQNVPDRSTDAQKKHFTFDKAFVHV